jgi:hypothetical protein
VWSEHQVCQADKFRPMHAGVFRHCACQRMIIERYLLEQGNQVFGTPPWVVIDGFPIIIIRGSGSCIHYNFKIQSSYMDRIVENPLTVNA